MKKAQSTLTGPTERAGALRNEQHRKMARSAHAYVRGNTVQFYQWLRARGRRALPAGPPIWICGDCHVGNLGPVADAEGRIDIQIRDLDQTVIGNPAHDLIRLALSLATAARGSDLPGVTTALMLEQMMEGYEQGLSHKKGRKTGQGDKPESVRVVMRQAMERTWKHLAKERLEDVRPNIPLGDHFWPLSGMERAAIDELFATDAARRLITSLKSRKDDARVTVLDAAYWMKGCSSLGLLRYAVLAGVGKASKPEDFCLLDIKEAQPAAAPRAPRGRMPRNNAKRVVEGARHLAPYLGERMMSATFMERPVFIRELLPQDLKLGIDQLTREEAVKAAAYLAGVVGSAHSRQMPSALRRQWRSVLQRDRTQRLDAPSWLWSSVVDLKSSHETAYLEHCRRYATMLKGAEHL
jgi:uncharacterized protein (DUF2252 family)